MRQHWRWAPVLLLALVSGGAAADSLNLNLREDALRVVYGVTPASKRGLEVEFGHFFNEDDQYVSHVGLDVSGESWSRQGVFDVGMGGRVVYVHTEPFDEAALAIGARFRFSPIQRVGFGGSLYYAPKVVAFMDGENYEETNVNIDYQLLPQAFVYVGYRHILVDFDKVENVELDDKFHMGMKLLF